MSVEPTVSGFSARSVDPKLNDEAFKPEIQNSGDGDSSSRVYILRDGCDEVNTVGDIEITEGISEEFLLDPQSPGFSMENMKIGDESSNPTERIVNSDNDLMLAARSPNVDEADHNLIREYIFADDNDSEDVFDKDCSSGEVEGDPMSESAAETQINTNLGNSADKKLFQCKDEQMSKSEFSSFDIVWGKVRSHPWWPGQIFHPSFASGMALKHGKKGQFLVAYFGDKTFAWNDKSRLKHFEHCFFRMEKQSSLDDFVVAVDDALGEFERRIVIGMSCGCIANDLIADLKLQLVENAGIKEGAYYPTMDQCKVVSSFDPDWLIGYIHALAQLPCGYSDKLEFVKAKAQLKAISLSKGYSELPEFCFCGEFLDNQEEISDLKGQETRQVDVEYKNDGGNLNDKSLKEKKRGHGRPSTKLGIVENGRKHKSLPELMKQTVDLSSLNQKKRKYGVNATSKSSLPHASSLKIGQCMSRAVKKMKLLTSVTNHEDIKVHNDVSKANLSASTVHDRRKGPTRNASSFQDDPVPRDLLSMLCSAAESPTKIHKFQPMVIDFFINYRDSHALDSLKDDDDKPLNLLVSKRGRTKVTESGLISVEVKSDYLKDSDCPDAIIEGSPKQDVDPYKGRKRKSKSRMKLKKKTKADSSTNLMKEEKLENSSMEEECN